MLKVARTLRHLRTTGGMLAALTLTLVTPAVAAADGERSFGKSCDRQPFTVPDGVHWLEVEVEGGHGGQGKHTARGGTAGAVQATLAVNPRDQLSLSVGEFGWFDGGGCGSIHGGDRGGADGGDSSGQDGASGASGSAIYDAGDAPLVIAGGGGGGGGDSGNSHEYGGPGGSGGNPGGNGEGGQGSGGASGGRAGCETGTHGGTGETTDNGFGGGAGGGGGGHRGGCGGRANSNGGGGGGGGGRSWAATGIAATFHSSTRSCPYSDSRDVSYWGAACDGRVTLRWSTDPGAITAVGGSAQQTPISSPFGRPLQAKVTDSANRPIGGAPVTFTLAGSGAAATFRTSGTATATARTGADGIATSPAFDADATAGTWTAEAAAAGTRAPAKYTLTNAKAATSTTVTASANPSFAGQSVRFTATVRPDVPLASTTPRGAVTFVLAGNGTTDPLGPPVALDDDGRAVSAPVVLGDAGHPVGDYEIRAQYGGDADHTAGSGASPHAVVAASTSTTVAAWKAPGVTGNPSTAGETIYFTATVAPQAGSTTRPTGTVQFAVGGVPFGSPMPVDPASGIAYSITTTEAPTDPLVLGSNRVTATYVSTATSLAASSGSMVEQVGANATAVELTSSANPALYGDAPTLTARVARGDAGPPPAGVVDFHVDGDPACDAVPVVAGIATCALTGALEPGAHELRAEYGGDAGQGLLPSRGELVQATAAVASGIAVTAVPSPSAFGTEVRLRATVPGAAAAGGDGGSVQFTLDGTPLGAAVGVVDGVAVSGPVPIDRAAPGLHLLGADFADLAGRVLPGHGAAIHRIDRAPTTLALTTSAGPAALGEPIRFTARVIAAPAALDGPLPVGDVRFVVDGLMVGEVIQVRDGIAVSDPVAGLAPGRHEVVAELSGSVGFAAGQAVIDQVVLPGPTPAFGGSSAAPAPVPLTPPSPGPAGAVGGGGAAVAVPRATLRAGRIAVSARGVATVAVVCTGPAGRRCQGRVVLERDGARLGARNVSIPAGGARQVAVYLDAAGRRLVSGRARAGVEASFAAMTGTVAGPSQRLTLLAARAPGAEPSRVAVLDGRGRLAVSLRCAARAPRRCTGTVTVDDAAGRTLGTARFSAPAGTSTVRIALRRPASVPATVRVRVTTTVGVGLPATRTATVRVTER